MSQSTRYQTLSELTLELGRLLTELQQRIDALSDLAAAVQALARAPAPIAAPARVVKADDLARAILLAGGACEATVALAIRQYLEAAESKSAAKRLAGCNEDTRIAMVNRWKRQLHYYTQTLAQLGVRVVTPELRDSVDPEVHEVVDQIQTSDAEHVGTIASVQRPMFRWRDAQGCEQIKPARVVAYVLAGENAMGRNGVVTQ